jgi:hypothetical protein
MRDSYQNEIDTDEKANHWLHLAEHVKIIETREEDEEEEEEKIFIYIRTEAKVKKALGLE